MEVTLPDLVGFIGVGLIVLAYFLLSSGKLVSDTIRYHMLNFVGAVLLLISLFYNWNLPSVIIEIIWIAISLYGIWRVIKSRNRS